MVRHVNTALLTWFVSLQKNKGIIEEYISETLKIETLFFFEILTNSKLYWDTQLYSENMTNS